MAIKLVLKSSVLKAEGLPWRLKHRHLCPFDADEGEQGSSICKNRKGLLVNKLSPLRSGGK